MKPWIPVLVAVALTGCSTVSNVGNPRQTRITYDCDRGPPVTVVFSGNTARIIDTGGGRDTVLTRQVTGSGLVYESATRTIRRQGDQIVYTIGRTAPMTCTPQRQPR